MREFLVGVTPPSVRPGSSGKPIPFPMLSTSNRKKGKTSSNFSFFRFEVLKIDRGAHPAWLTWESLSFPILSTSNRKHEKKLRSLSLFRFDVLKIDRGAHPALADPSQILSDLGQKSKFFRGARNRLGRVGIGSIRSVRAISSNFRRFRQPQIYSGEPFDPPLAPVWDHLGCSPVDAGLFAKPRAGSPAGRQTACIRLQTACTRHKGTRHQAQRGHGPPFSSMGHITPFASVRAISPLCVG